VLAKPSSYLLRRLLALAKRVPSWSVFGLEDGFDSGAVATAPPGKLKIHIDIAVFSGRRFGY
jgi:hypothetical protein